MCFGFSFVVTEDLKVYWAQPDRSLNGSHSAIMKQLPPRTYSGTLDSFRANCVLGECRTWSMRSFRFDRESTYGGEIPPWAFEHSNKIMNKVDKILKECKPIIRRYENTLTRAQNQRYDAKRRISNKQLSSADCLTELWVAESKCNDKIDNAFRKMSEQLSHIEGYCHDEIAVSNIPF